MTKKYEKETPKKVLPAKTNRSVSELIKIHEKTVQLLLKNKPENGGQNMDIEKLKTDELIAVSGGRENSPKVWAKKIEPVEVYDIKEEKDKKPSIISETKNQVPDKTLDEKGIGGESEDEIH